MTIIDRMLGRLGLVRSNRVIGIDPALQAEGGAAKRLDEHRELVELLEAEAPEFLEKHFWVRGWLDSQDNYLDGLLQVASSRNLVAPHWPKNIRTKSWDSGVRTDITSPL